MEPSYKYEFTQADVNNLISSLNALQITGLEQATVIVTLANKLKSPKNADEMGKKQLQELKDKYEPAKPEKNEAVDKVVKKTLGEKSENGEDSKEISK